MTDLSSVQSELNNVLFDLPYTFGNRWSSDAERCLHSTLFKCLAAQREDCLRLFFPQGTPTGTQSWSLREAQGAHNGAEYLASAKGTACGHIFKSGESTYACKTCAADDTCVLCTRCFESSDHEGHQVYISISPGNSGCCDCGDQEAWKREVICSIHSNKSAHSHGSKDKAKAAESADTASSNLPPDLAESVRLTVSRALDFVCDVFSCSPEQMRLAKTEASIREDERHSRLSKDIYGITRNLSDDDTDFCLVLWNDEKHTVDDVRNQVARACRKPKSFGYARAMEVNDIGRSIIHYSTDLSELLRMAAIIEQLKLTVTIRSARDSFREQMCTVIIDWIADISGCAVGSDGTLLRNVVCEELLRPWRTGSEAGNKNIASRGLDDHELEDNERQRRRHRNIWREMIQPPVLLRTEDAEATNDDFDDDPQEDVDYDDVDFDDDDDMEDVDEAHRIPLEPETGNMDIDFMDEDTDVTEAMEAALAGYPAPPPPPQTIPAARRRIMTPTDSEDGDVDSSRPSLNAPFGDVPKTPQVKTISKRPTRPSRHWLEKPEAFKGPRPNIACEDLWQRVRLDWLILYDLRLWKTLRINLRHLYITTVVVIPQFKRILGLRFAGLYTPLAELYLIADREPDHSIINLSIQMLTTPTITEEVVERGNFLTNLMAILYTFLTTRQVGYPEEVNPKAVLAFDVGTVTNRRMFHFFLDLRWLFQSEYVRYRIRSEPRYLLQFLDLVKLHQGICPNVRATGEHVEYESDAWISASLIIKEIDKLCRQVALSFEPKAALNDGNINLERAIRTVAQVAMINSFGYERRRFHQAELKSPLEFHTVGPFIEKGSVYKVPRHVVQSEPMSFHHPMHYLLSWLIEHGKVMSRDEIRSLLRFTPADLKDPYNAVRNTPLLQSNLSAEQLLSAILDSPLRVCAWLAQTKAGMWVRNGITLRHQANSYRSVTNRDIGYQRDIFMVQAGLVISGADGQQAGENYLAQIIDRFQMVNWMSGDYAVVPGFEESQQIDVIEDFFHLLVIALSERGHLTTDAGNEYPNEHILEHDIAHALCFKPLSFSELSNRVTEKVSESDSFNAVLTRITNFKAPEGLSDTGAFELKPEFIELVDPYYAHYTRNLREEAENVYRKHMARKTGQKAEDVVYEPRIQPITSGIFQNLAAFTRTALFAQVLFAALDFSSGAVTTLTSLPSTRIETFLHMVLHLVQIAVLEDGVADGTDRFVVFATAETHKSWQGGKSSIVKKLLTLSEVSEYASCHATIKHILRKMLERQPDKLSSLLDPSIRLLDRTATGSPASLSAEEREKKKQEALARQARVMAQMKQQQNSFLMNQGLKGFESDDDLEDDNMSITQDSAETTIQKKTWHFPTGTCILCQEATNDQRLFGTFAFLGDSNIIRTTPVEDPDYVREAYETPDSLDRSCPHRPSGVAGENKATVVKVAADGTVTESVRQDLSKGFPQSFNRFESPVSTSCGHIMHFSCFELYYTATSRRHAQQIARNHPENTDLHEFICPLCKALGNTFLPIAWKSKDCASDSEISSAEGLSHWLMQWSDVDAPSHDAKREDEIFKRSKAYVAASFMPSLVTSMDDMSLNSGSSQARVRVGYSISSLLRLGRNDPDAASPLAPSRPTPLLSSNTESSPNTGEVVKAYVRMRETVVTNLLGGLDVSDDKDSATGSAIARALGTTISAVEIASRGMPGVNSLSILDDLSEQTTTHLRILTDTFESYHSVKILGLTPSAGSNFVKRQNALRAMLFPTKWPSTSDSPPLYLGGDVFLFYNDWLAYLEPSVGEALSILQLCLWTEIVKVILAFWKIDLNHLQPNQTSLDQVYAASYMEIGRLAGLCATDGTSNSQPDLHKLQAVRVLIDRYSLAFLRKCIILLRIRYGLAFETEQAYMSDENELERLSKMLHILPIHKLFQLHAEPSSQGERLRSMTRHWIAQATEDTEIAVGLPHPAILELVGLPKNYDTLTEEVIRRRCPTTGKEITDPACCLFCGAIFCSQAVCCMKDVGQDGMRGGCWQHMQVCSNGMVGMFINIRKCMVLFMHGTNGSWLQAPYLDRHGEPDPTLRRHHPLYLNQKRYDKLMREVWLQHGVQNVISRKLEADINPGGWETL